MQFEDSARLDENQVPQIGDSKPPISRAALIFTFICAILCVILRRTGFLSVFFLVPLGICSIAYGSVAAWLSSFISVLGYCLVSLGIALQLGVGLGDTNIGLVIVYFCAFTLGFTGIMTNRPFIFRFRTLYRFIFAAIAGALASTGMILYFSRDKQHFYDLLRSQLEKVIPFSSYGGLDTAQQAYLDQLLNPDFLVEASLMIFIRGGALISAFFLLFFSRQAAFILAKLFRMQGGSALNDLTGFYAPRKAIWVLSFCLPVIMLCRKAASLQPVEITAWNILVICVIMFLAQGGGIVLFNFVRRPMSFVMRLFCILLAVVVLFSPGLNVMTMGFLVLLGIAETWLPLRKSEQKTVNS